MRPVDDSRRRPNCTLANLLPVQNVLPPLPHNKTYSKSDPRCLITKPTRRVIRCLTNKSTRKEVATERRSVPRSGVVCREAALVGKRKFLVLPFFIWSMARRSGCGNVGKSGRFLG